MKNLDTTLYFITDSTCVPEERFLLVVEAACKGGATIIQLREKDKSTREYMQLAEAVHAITSRYGIPLIIDDRVDVALAIGAEGVHVGQSDMPVSMARKLMGEGKIGLWSHLSHHDPRKNGYYSSRNLKRCCEGGTDSCKCNWWTQQRQYLCAKGVGHCGRLRSFCDYESG